MRVHTLSALGALLSLAYVVSAAPAMKGSSIGDACGVTTVYVTLPPAANTFVLNTVTATAISDSDISSHTVSIDSNKFPATILSDNSVLTYISSVETVQLSSAEADALRSSSEQTTTKTAYLTSTTHQTIFVTRTVFNSNGFTRTETVKVTDTPSTYTSMAYVSPTSVGTTTKPLSIIRGAGSTADSVANEPTTTIYSTKVYTVTTVNVVPASSGGYIALTETLTSTSICIEVADNSTPSWSDAAASTASEVYVVETLTVVPLATLPSAADYVHETLTVIPLATLPASTSSSNETTALMFHSTIHSIKKASATTDLPFSTTYQHVSVSMTGISGDVASTAVSKSSYGTPFMGWNASIFSTATVNALSATAVITMATSKWASSSVVNRITSSLNSSSTVTMATTRPVSSLVFSSYAAGSFLSSKEETLPMMSTTLAAQYGFTALPTFTASSINGEQVTSMGPTAIASDYLSPTSNIPYILSSSFNPSAATSETCTDDYPVASTTEISSAGAVTLSSVPTTPSVNSAATSDFTFSSTSTTSSSSSNVTSLAVLMSLNSIDAGSAATSNSGAYAYSVRSSSIEFGFWPKPSIIISKVSSPALTLSESSSVLPDVALSTPPVPSSSSGPSLTISTVDSSFLMSTSSSSASISSSETTSTTVMGYATIPDSATLTISSSFSVSVSSNSTVSTTALVDAVTASLTASTVTSSNTTSSLTSSTSIFISVTSSTAVLGYGIVPSLTTSTISALLSAPISSSSTTSTADLGYGAIPVLATSTTTPLPISLSSSLTASTPTLAYGAGFTTTSPLPKPTVCGEHGDFVLNFDDLPRLAVFPNVTDFQPEPLFSPYHQFFFNEGFRVVPLPTDPYLPSSHPLLTEFIASPDVGTIGAFGNGKTELLGCFNFNAYGMSLGCNSTGPDCHWSITGLRYDFTSKSSLMTASHQLSTPACPSLSNCTLVPVTLDNTFQNLTEIRIHGTIAGVASQIWWMDDVKLGWYDNGCDAGLCRQEHE